jgi:hypothetical protein
MSLTTDLCETPPNLSKASQWTAMNGYIRAAQRSISCMPRFVDPLRLSRVFMDYESKHDMRSPQAAAGGPKLARDPSEIAASYRAFMPVTGTCQMRWTFYMRHF